MSASSLVQFLVDFAASVDAEYSETVHGTADETPEVLAIVLAAIRDARADLATLAKSVEADLMAIAGEKRFVVSGLGEVAIRASTKRNEWDSEGLTRKLVALALDERILDEKTGEYERESEAVARVLTECAGISYWRVGPLRARGLQIDEWCTETPQDFSVQLPPRVSA